MYDAGGIKYTIEADAAALLQAEALIDKSLEKQSKAFSEADKKVRDYEATQAKLGRTINSSGMVLSKNNKILVEQTKEYRQLSAAANNTYEAMLRQTQVAQGVQRSFSGAGAAATNLSYQIQDIAVQMQMGMNGFMIAAQQIPQMLVGMGALAGAIGAGVAIAGGLAMAFIDTRTEAEKLEDQVEKVKAVITLSASGVANYSEEMMRLAKISEQLAKIKLAATLREQEQAIKSSAAALKETWSDQGTIFSNTNATIAKELKVSVGVVQEFDKAIRGLGLNPTAEQMQKVETALLGLQSAGAGATKEGLALINSAVNMIQKFKEGQITAEALKSSLDDIGKVSSNTAEKTKTLADGLNLQLIELEKGSRAAFEQSLILEGLDEVQRKTLLTIYDNVQAKKQEAQAQRDLNKEIEDYAALGDRYVKDEERRKASLASSGKTIGLSDSEVFKLQQEERHNILKQMLEAGLISEQRYIERRNNLYNESNKQLSSSFDAMQNQAIGTMASVIVGAQDGKEAVRSLALSIGTQLVGALLKQGIAAATAATTASTAQTAANTAALPSATALASAQSLASFGANSGPALTGIAAVTAAALGIAAIAGKREMGGPVSNGKSYLVGERGPEIFTPSASGSITSNKDLMSGSQSVNVIVNNNAPGTTASASQNSSGDIEVVINAISDQVISGQGKFARALKQGTNTQFKASL